MPTYIEITHQKIIHFTR